MVNPQVSLLNWTLEADIPGDVMWSLIDGKHIVSVPHQDGLFVNRVDGGPLVAHLWWSTSGTPMVVH